MPRLGVMGTMVWDRIFAPDERDDPTEEWGGLSYALAALQGAVPDGWEIVPIVKVGRDLEEQARSFLEAMPSIDLRTGVRVVDDPNNRVELHYHERERRTECMRGGVSAWTAPELAPVLQDVDALYVNFISGMEMDLETARRLRLTFPGPIYTDLHSLLLGIGPGGRRMPQPLPDWQEWLRCFDVVQVNEDELATLADGWGDPWGFAAAAVGESLRLLLVTLGARGAAYVASSAFRPDPRSWRRSGLATDRPLSAPGLTKTEYIPPVRTVRDGDPTGCGDVWGATCFAHLLAHAPLEWSIRAANEAAACTVEHRGASGLHEYLQARIGS